MLNLVFIGASRFGLQCLELALNLSDIRVLGVVTAPSVFSISYRPAGVKNVLYADIPSYAKQHDLPVVVLQKRMNEPGLLETVRSWQPDAFLVAGWYHMIPKSWRNIAPAYGLHASLLPDYSGGAPLVWAMINGEEKTGITLFKMDGGVDSGPIAAQMEEPIYPSDTIATLYSRIEKRGLDILRQALPKMASGQLILTPQNESMRRTMPQRSPADGLIDWKWDVERIDRFIRAQTHPYPGAFGLLDGKRFTIWSGEKDTVSPVISPGLIIKDRNDRYSVACGHGRLILKDISYCDRNYDKNQLSELLKDGQQILDAEMKLV